MFFQEGLFQIEKQRITRRLLPRGWTALKISGFVMDASSPSE